MAIKPRMTPWLVLRRWGWCVGWAAGGVKSTGEHLQEAVDLVRELLPNAAGLGPALRHLEAIIHEKSRVSYTGDPFTATDIARMRTHYERFAL